MLLTTNAAKAIKQITPKGTVCVILSDPTCKND